MSGNFGESAPPMSVYFSKSKYFVAGKPLYCKNNRRFNNISH